MERMITEGLTYFLESRGLLSPDQSGFRKGRGTMDPVLCLELDIWKDFDMWKEGLLIKLEIMGLGGSVLTGLKRSFFWTINTSEGGELYVRKV